MSFNASAGLPGHAGIQLGKNFHYGEVDYSNEPSNPPNDDDAPLGVLEHFKGAWKGPGFNTIFRPNNAPTTTTFPIPVNPAPPVAVLELNLTEEELSFSKPLGNVPNRGLDKQSDIFLNGVSYIQVVKDMTNTATGKADANPIGIHTETGFFLAVPPSTDNPRAGKSLVRMASIPHGTTINVQGATQDDTPGAPDIGPRDITPFTIGQPKDIQPKDSQKANLDNQPRLPQDLTKFIKEGTITQEILKNPSTLLLNINKQLNITKTNTFELTTQSDGAFPGGGVANIAFLVGGGGSGPNASAVQLTSTFWVETIESEITIPSFQEGADPLCLKPKYNAAGAPGTAPPPLPTFKVKPHKTITSPVTIPVTYTQIQYEQIVLLNFKGLSWPHLSLATLVPAEDIKVEFPSS